MRHDEVRRYIISDELADSEIEWPFLPRITLEVKKAHDREAVGHIVVRDREDATRLQAPLFPRVPS